MTGLTPTSLKLQELHDGQVTRPLGQLEKPTLEKNMKSSLGFGLGMFTGTVLYTYFFSITQQVDWTRSVFVGLLSFVAAAVWFRIKSKEEQGRGRHSDTASAAQRTES